MRIISGETYVAECSDCKVKLEYEESDIQIGAYGCSYIKCPKCGELIFTDDVEHSVTLTRDNIQFPQHFCEFGPGAVKLSDEKINEYIKECIDKLENRNSDYGEFVYTATGDTIIFVVKFEDEYPIYVARGYWSSSIPR